MSNLYKKPEIKIVEISVGNIPTGSGPDDPFVTEEDTFLNS